MCIEPFELAGELHNEGNATSRNQSPVQPGRTLKIVDMFPSSAVRIVFGWESTIDGGGVDNDVAVAMLQDLEERKAELLPNLESIEFELVRNVF